MTLKDITITPRQKTYYEENIIDLGAESNIHKNSPTTIIKIWKDEVITKKEKNNKQKKLRKLHAKNIKYIPTILSTYSIKKQCVGYEMSFDELDIPMVLSPLTTSDKIIVLKQLKEILQYFSENGIIYPDLKNDNILINQKTSNITICDIDNSKVDNLPIELYPHYALQFVQDYQKEDKMLHSYMHNLYTLSELTDAWQDEVVENIQNGMYQDFFQPQGKKILKQMKKITPQYQGGYLIDYIK